MTHIRRKWSTLKSLCTCHIGIYSRITCRICGADFRTVAQESAARRLVREVGRQPPLDLLDPLPFSAGVAGHLIFAEPPDGEVPRLRVREIQTADARRR